MSESQVVDAPVNASVPAEPATPPRLDTPPVGGVSPTPEIPVVSPVADGGITSTPPASEANFATQSPVNPDVAASPGEATMEKAVDSFASLTQESVATDPGSQPKNESPAGPGQEGVSRMGLGLAEAPGTEPTPLPVVAAEATEATTPPAVAEVPPVPAPTPDANIAPSAVGPEAEGKVEKRAVPEKVENAVRSLTEAGPASTPAPESVPPVVPTEPATPEVASPAPEGDHTTDSTHTESPAATVEAKPDTLGVVVPPPEGADSDPTAGETAPEQHVDTTPDKPVDGAPVADPTASHDQPAQPSDLGNPGVVTQVEHPTPTPDAAPTPPAAQQKSGGWLKSFTKLITGGVE